MFEGKGKVWMKCVGADETRAFAVLCVVAMLCPVRSKDSETAVRRHRSPAPVW